MPYIYVYICIYIYIYIYAYITRLMIKNHYKFFKYEDTV